MESQNKEILKYLKKGKRLTAMDALGKFGCFRMAARANDLRNHGHNIKTEIIELNGKRVAEYRLV
jgi:hypothetical protein